MATILQRVQFGFIKKQILSHKTADFLKWDLALSASHSYTELFMLDPQLMSFLYAGICSDKDVEVASSVLMKIFEKEPRRSINQKNLMVVIRRLIVEGEISTAVKSLKLLSDKNGVKKCLGSKYYLEALECLATFDSNGLGRSIIEEFEKKEPELSADNSQFQITKAIYEHEASDDQPEEIDLVELENNEEKSSNGGSLLGETEKQDGLKLAPNSRLWAGPIK